MMSHCHAIAASRRYDVGSLHYFNGVALHHRGAAMFYHPMACHCDGVPLWRHRSTVALFRSGFMLQCYSAVVLRHCDVATL
jgi:hypothetical protein